ncbi:MAG: hypothetical protein U9N49_04610 [Campylobacterota bacterium]|nr:hypothetical protein [Campylobacterota bacterium]
MLDLNQTQEYTQFFETIIDFSMLGGFVGGFVSYALIAFIGNLYESFERKRDERLELKKSVSQ